MNDETLNIKFVGGPWNGKTGTAPVDIRAMNGSAAAGNMIPVTIKATNDKGKQVGEYRPSGSRQDWDPTKDNKPGYFNMIFRPNARKTT